MNSRRRAGIRRRGRLEEVKEGEWQEEEEEEEEGE